MQRDTNKALVGTDSSARQGGSAMSGEVYLIHGTNGLVPYARKVAKAVGGAFRAPHHTASVTGVLSELALAAGGVLYLDDVVEFSLASLSSLLSTWSRMNIGVRPTLVLGLTIRTDEGEMLADARRLERVSATFPPIDRHVVLNATGCSDEGCTVVREPSAIANYELRVSRVALQRAPAPVGVAVHSPNALVEAARALIGDSAQEHFLVFLLDTRNRIIGYTEACRGGVDSCPVDPGVVFRAAIASGARGIAVAHNHPSGDSTPSTADRRLTKTLQEAAKLLGIAVIDHVIVTDEGYMSFAERDLL